MGGPLGSPGDYVVYKHDTSQIWRRYGHGPAIHTRHRADRLGDVPPLAIPCYTQANCVGRNFGGDRPHDLFHALSSRRVRTHGWLLPARASTPPNGCTTMGLSPPSDALLFIAGTNAFWTQSKEKSTVLVIGNIAPLYVERNGNELALDADINDTTGNLIARIGNGSNGPASGHGHPQARLNRLLSGWPAYFSQTKGQPRTNFI